MLGAHQGDFAGEEGRLRSFVERSHPDAPAILEALANGYRISRRWNEALQALNALIAYSPDCATLLVQRGTILHRLHGPAAAEEDCRRAVALARESAAAHAALAGVLSDLGYTHEVMDHYERAVRSQPADVGALLGLARALTDAAKLVEAEKWLDELLAAHPDHPDGLVERGRLALRQGRTAEAEGLLARAVRVAPWHRDGHQLYLVALKELGWSEAVSRCEARLAELQAEDAINGRLELRARNMPQAVDVRWELWLWSQRNGEAEAGLVWLTEILRLAPRHAAAHAAFADYFDRASQPRRAALHRAAAAGR
jgi:tetratricopeptide (TPR) repeat protein